MLLRPGGEVTDYKPVLNCPAWAVSVNLVVSIQSLVNLYTDIKKKPKTYTFLFQVDSYTQIRSFTQRYLRSE